jgi:predicted ATPase/DNA-binding SARP family transcriptional activator
MVKLYLFGAPRFERAGRNVDIRPRKALALFIYLAMTAKPHSRDALATLLWPESDQMAARASLRRTLHRLQQALPPGLIAAEADTIRLAPEVELWVDTNAFSQVVAECLPAAAVPGDESYRARLAAAVELYSADFLAGFTLEDAPEFDEWQFFQQESLRRALAQVLVYLVQSHTQEGNYAQAIDYARRWLAVDPLHEPAHRELMRLYAWAGQQAAAIRQYQECRRILEQELGGPPEPETSELYELIRTKRLPAPSPVMAGTAAVPAAPGDGTPRPRHNLPPQLTPFVGRNAELARIRGLLLQDPHCRLLTLVGLGGIGKTRLALQVAQSLADDPEGTAHFPDGVWFVPLAPVGLASGMPTAIGEAIGMEFQGALSSHQQLLAYLRDKRLLLVLDDLDHLVAGVDQLSEILAGAPGVKLLVTTREALSLREAWFYPVGGMSFPSGRPDGDLPWDTYESVQLFAAGARRARVDFALEPVLEPVVRICRLVEGMPLALELAAAWLKALPVEQVADEIERGLDILTARHRNLPERHRSMRVVLDQSWARLSEDEQQVFCRLAVFCGGFRLPAAQAIAGASLLILAALVEKSLLSVTPGGRYTLHDLVRQYALAKLKEAPFTEQEVYHQYSVYYLQLLQTHRPRLITEAQPAALAEIEEEFDNIRFAWEWSLRMTDLAVVDPAVMSFCFYFRFRGRAQEGAELLAQGLTWLTQNPAAAKRAGFEEARLQMLQEQARFSYFLGNLDDARREFNTVLATARTLGDKNSAANALAKLGAIAAWQSQHALAREQLQASLALFRELGSINGMADVLHELARASLAIGDYLQAERESAESLALSRQTGRPDWTGYSFTTLGLAAFARGEYALAQRHYEEALAAFQKGEHELGKSIALGGLGMVTWGADPVRWAEAEDLTLQSLTICRRIGHRLQTAHRLCVRALIANSRGDYTNARCWAEEASTLAVILGSHSLRAYSLAAQGESELYQGDLDGAHRHLVQAVQTAREWQLPPRLTLALYQYACLLVKEHAPAAQIRRILQGVIDHPACWHLVRQRAHALLNQVPQQGAGEGESLAAPPLSLDELAEEVEQTTLRLG